MSSTKQLLNHTQQNSNKKVIKLSPFQLNRNARKSSWTLLEQSELSNGAICLLKRISFLSTKPGFCKAGIDYFERTSSGTTLEPGWYASKNHPQGKKIGRRQILRLMSELEYYGLIFRVQGRYSWKKRKRETTTRTWMTRFTTHKIELLFPKPGQVRNQYLNLAKKSMEDDNGLNPLQDEIVDAEKMSHRVGLKNFSYLLNPRRLHRKSVGTPREVVGKEKIGQVKIPEDLSDAITEFHIAEVLGRTKFSPEQLQNSLNDLAVDKARCNLIELKGPVPAFFVGCALRGQLYKKKIGQIRNSESTIDYFESAKLKAMEMVREASPKVDSYRDIPEEVDEEYSPLILEEILIDLRPVNHHVKYEISSLSPVAQKAMILAQLRRVAR